MMKMKVIHSETPEIQELVEVELKNKTWENNHLLITKAIATSIYQKNILPSKSEIAEATGLSRQSVHKHLKQFGEQPALLENIEQVNLMTNKVMANMLGLAMSGDVKAARLVMEITGVLNGKMAVINNGRNEKMNEAASAVPSKVLGEES